MNMKSCLMICTLALLTGLATVADAQQISEGESLLRHDLYAKIPLIPFKKSSISTLYRVWPQEEQAKLKGLIQVDAYNTVLDYYGFRRTSYDNAGFPLGLTPAGRDKAYVNCMMCHTGQVNGNFVMGLGDTQANFALFAKDYIKATTGISDSLIKRGLGRYIYVDDPTDGVNYASGFFLLGLAVRNEDEHLDYKSFLKAPPKDFRHLASDAPPWWNVKYKSVTTMTGLSKHSPKGMMQFFLGTTLSSSRLKSMLPTVEKLYNYLETLEAPVYPGVVDAVRAKRGELVFKANCVRCHGEKTPDGKYQYTQKYIPLTLVKTDSARSDADDRTADLLKKYNRSWMTDYGASAVQTKSGHYIPPPLHGVWATAPYLHNGSVPTLRGMFFHEERPAIWKRKGGYDIANPGLSYQEIAEAQFDHLSWREKLRTYNTRLYSQGNQGHPFGSQLATEEKVDLIEYLKTF
jgi:hypothetical protein